MTKNTISMELPQLEKLDQLEKLGAVLEKLDDILVAMQNLGDRLGASTESPQSAPERTEIESKETLAPEVEQATATNEPARVVKLSDIQQKVVELSAAGMKAQVRDIVKAYAEKVSAIPEDKLQEVWAQLDSLEA